VDTYRTFLLAVAGLVGYALVVFVAGGTGLLTRSQAITATLAGMLVAGAVLTVAAVLGVRR
jgi:hypothetical protein